MVHVIFVTSSKYSKMSFKKGTLNSIIIVFANNTYMGQAKTININNINNIHEIKYGHITKNKF